MEVLDLPPPLQAVLDGLGREASRAAIASSIRRLLQQAQSPLSLVRQDAYASLAASLDSYLRDPASSRAVLPALGSVWPELLQSVALGLRQGRQLAEQQPGCTPTAGGTPTAGSGTAAAASPGHGPVASPGTAASLAYRHVSATELTCMVRVLQLCCLLSPPARRSSLGAGVLPPLLGLLLPATPPELACAAMDAVLAVLLRHPAAFVGFAEQGGVQQVCQLLRDRGSSEPVRAHAVQFLNLLLTQLVPELLPPELVPPSPSPATPAPGTFPPPSHGPPSPAPRAPSSHTAPCAGQPEVAAAVVAALEGAKAAVAEVLGREARAMLLRRISLSDVSAEVRLGQLSSALTLFIESDA